MQVQEDQLDSEVLTTFAVEAIDLLCARAFDTFTQRFPYALAYGRDPGAAVAEDLARCFAEAPGLEEALSPQNAQYKVGYFSPNDTGLHALVECRFIANSGDELLVELVVIGKSSMVLALEQMSVFLAEPAV